MNITYPYIHADGSIRRLTVHDEGIILATREVLANMIPPEWVPVHGIINRQGQPIAIVARRGGAVIAAAALDHIEIKCKWRKVTDGRGEGKMDFLVPHVFNDAGDGHPNDVVIPTVVSRRWNPPADIRMFFAIMKNATEGGVPTPLFLWIKRDGQFVRPPLTNLYDDGKVCLGGGNHIQGSNIMDQLMSAIDLFFSAPYGSHLMPRDNVMEAWFKFLMKGSGEVTQVPPTPEMYRNLQAIDTDITQAITMAITT